MHTQLISAIYQLAADLPEIWVEKLAIILQTGTPGDWHALQSGALQSIAPQHTHQRIVRFFNVWRDTAPAIAPQAVALALQTAAFAAEQQRRAQQLELVWTGPDSKIIPLRRTDQTLLQLINEARETLHIVSFAVYKAKAIQKALIAAAGRGVSVALYLETPDAGAGKIGFDPIRALGSNIVRVTQVYEWSPAQRPHTEDGKYGSLHAKVAVADSRTMLISSANLTEYAMTLNMELGILVKGGALPAQVDKHLTRLIEDGVFVAHTEKAE